MGRFPAHTVSRWSMVSRTQALVLWFLVVAFGMLSPAGPAWYVVWQGVIGVIQFVIALIMLADYRRSGIWGAG
jgi:hypothetical protein